MSRIACQSCGHVLASPRGQDRVRFVQLPIVVLRQGGDGRQAIETVCPRCRKDVEIVIPAPPDTFRGRPSVASQAR